MKNNTEKEHQFRKAIEAQLHLMDLAGLQTIMKLATEITCPEGSSPKGQELSDGPF